MQRVSQPFRHRAQGVQVGLVIAALALTCVTIIGTEAASSPTRTKTGFFYPTLTVTREDVGVTTPFLAGSRSSDSRYDFATKGEAAVHTGVDLSAPLGAPVYALADGEVDLALSSVSHNGFGWSTATGKVDKGGVLIIKHWFRDLDDTTQTFYALYGHLDFQHLSAWLRGKKQIGGGKPSVIVKAGEEVGHIGPWNPKWGYHLHLGIRKGTVPASYWGMLPKSLVDKPDGTTDRMGWEDPWEFIHKYAPTSDQTAMSTVMPKGRTIRVIASGDWTDTGVAVRRGESLIIRTEGRWSHGEEGDGELPYYGAQGYEKVDPAAVLPRARVGELIARIGAEGRPVRLGVRTTFMAAKDGRVYLRMNDVQGLYENNQGELRCDIVRK